MPQLLDLQAPQGLGQQVSRHLGCSQMLSLNQAKLHHVSKPIKAKIKVFHPPMVLWVVGNRDSRLVVNEEGGGRVKLIAKL